MIRDHNRDELFFAQFKYLLASLYSITSRPIRGTSTFDDDDQRRCWFDV